MKLVSSFLLAVLMSVAVPASANGPVAVRVEVEPLGPAEVGMRVEVTVQVAPEDRGRIGRNAMVRIELDGDPPPGQSPLWAVRMEDDGSGSIETVWPSGEHQLRVVISNPSGRDSGLWVGTVRVPGSAADAAEAEPSPRPAQGPQPRPEGVGGAAVGAGALAATARPEEAAPVRDEQPAVADREAPVTSAPADSGAEAAAAATGVDRLVASETPPAPDPVERPAEPVAPVGAGEVDTGGAEELPLAAVESTGRPEQAETAPIEATESGLELGEPAAVVGVGVPAPKSEPTGGTVFGPTGTTGGAVEVPVETEPVRDADAASPKVAEAPAEKPEPAEAMVEPLRGEMAAAGAPGEAPAVLEPEPKPAPPPADAVALARWSEADPATSELTAVVLRGRQPADDLRPDDLRLRIARADVPIDAIAGPEQAPLMLGIAVDAGPESGIGWPGAGGRLQSLAERAIGGRGDLFYAAPGRPAGEWGSGPPAEPSSTDGNVASLVEAALQRFDDTRGRRFLLVITDGRSEPDKEAWRSAADAAGEAGVPVLVVALWDDDFSQRTRKRLRDITDASGGSLFLVQGLSQLERAADRFGPLLDGGVAVRFRIPDGTALPAPVELESPDRELEVSAPRGIR